jgi:hypothetical protein
MPGFDIDSLLQFDPPRHMCVKCRALNYPIRSAAQQAGGERTRLVCNICNLVYVPTSGLGIWDLKKYLESQGATISFKDPIGHGQALAGIARQIRSKDRRGPMIRYLFQALVEANRFVHLTTYGISHQFIGALKLAAQRVAVRAVVTNADPSTLCELKEFGDEAPRLEVHAYGADDQIRDVPHQKLIVIDGLLAFKGSTNLTLNGWRKAEKGLDILEAVTDVADVIRLHNEYFAPLWARASSIGEAVEMIDDIPF